MISFDNRYAVIGWSILGFFVLIAVIVVLIIIVKITTKNKLKLKLGDKSIELGESDTEKESISDISPEKKINKFEVKYNIDEIKEKQQVLDNIPLNCLNEQMNVVNRFNTTMNLQMKEHYSTITGYNEGAFQWKFYCLCLLELVRQSGEDFCKKFLQQNHIAEKPEAEYKLYCESKKDEGWNTAKNIISSYYDDGLLTLNRIEYFQKAGSGLRMLYNTQMDNIFGEVRQIALKYQKLSDDTKQEILLLEESLYSQCEEG